jgi:hypothetical protein
MTWPGLVFGAAAGWQPGESSIEDFEAAYDWAFYRNTDATFLGAIKNLNRTHALLRQAKFESATDDLFWSDPFTETGAREMQRALPVARDLRLAAEQALTAIYDNRKKAHANAETLEAMIFAALRLDALGMKIQFTREIDEYYADAFANQGDVNRVGQDLDEINSMNARLEDLRDATTRLREMYAKNWLSEDRPYWLPNVLVRYETFAREVQEKIVAVRQAGTQFETQKTLPPPQQLGFFLLPDIK